VFHQDSGGFGLLTSITAIGSLMGALIGARIERPRLRYLIGACAALAVTSATAALMPTYELFGAALVPVGICTLMLMTSANSTVQLGAAPHMRGRVMALYMAVFMGGTAIGGPIIGWIGQTVGARAAILVGAIVAMAAALIATAWTLHRQRQSLPPVAETGAPAPYLSRDDVSRVG
jgi:MFS family permease